MSTSSMVSGWCGPWNTAAFIRASSGLSSGFGAGRRDRDCAAAREVSRPPASDELGVGVRTGGGIVEMVDGVEHPHSPRRRMIDDGEPSVFPARGDFLACRKDEVSPGER